MNTPHKVPATNLAIANLLREAARLLEQQGASPFRAAAYRKGADVVEMLDGDIRNVASRGLEALEALPHIGRGLAAAILEIVDTGHWSQLDRLRGASEPETIVPDDPGRRTVLARDMHDTLTPIRWRPWKWQPMTGGWPRCRNRPAACGGDQARATAMLSRRRRLPD